MKQMHHMFLAGCMLMAGCAAGPDFHRPDAPKVSGYTKDPVTQAAGSAGNDAQHFVQGMDIPGEWWTLFKSPELDALIKQSIRANPDLKAAQAALRIAQENVKAQQGFYYPSVTGNYNATRQKVAESVSGSSPLPNEQLIFSLYTAQLAISYSPDVFGLNGRTVESLQAQADYERYQLAAAYVTLTSNVVAACVQEASLRAQIDATHAIIRDETQMLDILRRQQTLGFAAGLDVAAQETQLAQAQAALPPLEKQLAQQRDLLTALAGRYSSDEINETFELSKLHLPQDLPLSLPSGLIRQRPDILSAEEQLHAASAEVGIAVANRLPQFTIDAGAGDTGTRFRHLFNPMDSFWSLAGGLTQPIFDGGTLLHKERGARAAYEQAAEQYRSTVITAFQNMADTLHALKSDTDGLKTAMAAEQAARKALDITTRQYKVGYANYLALLNAEQAYLQAKISLVQAQAGRFADTAALFQALGGGWWHTGAMAANAPSSAGGKLP